MASCLCGGSVPRRTFRIAYAALAEALQDAHFANLARQYELVMKDQAAGRMAWSDLLGEQWPYSSSLPRLADRACHDELVRIEVAWARALSRGGLQSSCKAQSATKLAAVFANASQQLFPFPMATMLASAAEANLLDSHSWRILRELNVLCDPRAAMHPRADAFLIAPDLSDSALRMQRDAVEGAGYGRTQRRLGRTQRAPPLKFGSGSLAGALYTDALFARLSGCAIVTAIG